MWKTNHLQIMFLGKPLVSHIHISLSWGVQYVCDTYMGVWLKQDLYPQARHCFQQGKACKHYKIYMEYKTHELQLVCWLCTPMFCWIVQTVIQLYNSTIFNTSQLHAQNSIYCKSHFRIQIYIYSTVPKMIYLTNEQAMHVWQAEEQCCVSLMVYFCMKPLFQHYYTCIYIQCTCMHLLYCTLNEQHW